MVELDASDLHLKVGSPPGYRVHGEIVPFAEYPILNKHETRGFIEEILDADQFKAFEATGDFDLSKAIPGISRFRVNCNKQRGNYGMVIRRIPEQVPTLDELNAPAVFRKFCELPRGLVLVTGPTGSGKSTTLAAMIDHINRTEAGHILTMEDPIEFVHLDKKSFVNQREIGQDSKNFTEALRRALRQDPDVILVGEMRDLETISLAITAAETGHLVFGTLHTTSAIQTVDRIIDVFPHESQQQVRMQLAMTLAGVVAQTLVPKVGGGRVAVHEILMGTDGVRACVREGKTHMIANLLQTGLSLGMQSLEQGMCEAVKKGIITFEAGLQRVNSVSFYKMLLGMSDKDTAPPAQAAAAQTNNSHANGNHTNNAHASHSPAPNPQPAIPTPPARSGDAPPAARFDDFESFRKAIGQRK